jgi:hypothetical protein
MFLPLERMSEVILNLVKKKHQSKSLCSTRDLVAKLSGESFSPVPVKYEHIIYINPASPY